MPEFCTPLRMATHGPSTRRAAALLAVFFALGLLSACDAASALISDPAGKRETQGDAPRGQRLLAAYQCGSCHAIPGVVAARGDTAAPLDAFGKRSYIAGRIPNQADTLARWIVSPAALIPDTPMPSMGVSSEDARDMAAYLGTLQ